MNVAGVSLTSAEGGLVMDVLAPKTNGLGGASTSIVSGTDTVFSFVSVAGSFSASRFRGEAGLCRLEGLFGAASSTERLEGLELRNDRRGLFEPASFSASGSFASSSSFSAGLPGSPNLNSRRKALAGVRSNLGISSLNVDGVEGRPNLKAGLGSGLGSCGFADGCNTEMGAEGLR